MTHDRQRSTDALNAARRRATAFVPDTTHARVCGAGATLTHNAELRRFVSERLAQCDTRLSEGTLTLFQRVPFAQWSRCMRVGFVRTTSLTEWRETRSHDAVIDALMGAIAQPHTRTRAQEHTLTVNGQVTARTRTRTNEQALACVVEYRRQARRYRRAFLRSHYWGTLTSDGMALNATSTANRLAPLDRAIALSDVYIAEHGHTLTEVRYARGVLRHDDHSVDSAATLTVAKTRHTHKGR